ncbi:MAG: tetratricopeptide repeat protein [Candidatus Poribacteria bacterium]|nr:tetratricopeptide repeat protein [Candidatus Poribacteria bacterium]
MNSRIWGIIGGAALVLALLSPLILGNAQKVERLFEAAEALSERSDYEGAIKNYKAALKESKKFGAKTERIDKDFTTLVNLKIGRCYYELGEDSSDVRHYQNALRHIEEVVLEAQVVKHKEELTYLWAETLYKTGKLDQAKLKFSQLIEKFPNSRWVSKSLYAIGDINYQQENYDAACKTFQKLIAEFPHSELKAEAERRIAELTLLCDETDPPVPDPCEAMYEAASNLQRQGKVHDAYQGYTDLITRCPESEYITDAYVGKAEIHLEAEDYVKAREYYEAAMYSTTNEERTIELHEAYHRTYLVPEYGDKKRQHSSSDEFFVKARLLRKEKRFLEAAEIYEELANNNLPAEDIVYALYWAGRCYHGAACTTPNLFNRSVSAFKKLIENYSSGEHTTEAYYHLALVYIDWAQKSGNISIYQLIIDTVEEANDAEYTDSKDVRNRGWLSRMQELKDEAHEKLYPLPDPLKAEAERTINAAEIAIDRAKQENREIQLIHEADEHLANARQQVRRNNYRAALNQAKKALEIINMEPILSVIQRYVEEGHTYLKQGKLEKAMEKARQALSLDQNYSPAHKLQSKIKERYYGLGWTFFDEEQYGRAIDVFKNAIKIDPNFKEAHNHLGVVYIKQGKYLEAIVALEEAINIDGAFKEAYFNLALAYLELSELEDAINAANAALEIDPNYEPARMLIEFIAD